jgi:hypothetical protein
MVALLQSERAHLNEIYLGWVEEQRTTNAMTQETLDALGAELEDQLRGVRLQLGDLAARTHDIQSHLGGMHTQFDRLVNQLCSDITTLISDELVHWARSYNANLRRGSPFAEPYDPESVHPNSTIEDLLQPFISFQTTEPLVFIAGNRKFGKTWTAAHLVDWCNNQETAVGLFFSLAGQQYKNQLDEIFHTSNLLQVHSQLRSDDGSPRHFFFAFDGLDTLGPDLAEEFLNNLEGIIHKAGNTLRVLVTCNTPTWENETKIQQMKWQLSKLIYNPTNHPSKALVLQGYDEIQLAALWEQCSIPQHKTAPATKLWQNPAIAAVLVDEWEETGHTTLVDPRNPQAFFRLFYDLERTNTLLQRLGVSGSVTDLLVNLLQVFPNYTTPTNETLVKPVILGEEANWRILHGSGIVQIQRDAAHLRRYVIDPMYRPDIKEMGELLGILAKKVPPPSDESHLEIIRVWRGEPEEILSAIVELVARNPQNLAKVRILAKPWTNLISHFVARVMHTIPPPEPYVRKILTHVFREAMIEFYNDPTNFELVEYMFIRGPMTGYQKLDDQLASLRWRKWWTTRDDLWVFVAEFLAIEPSEVGSALLRFVEGLTLYWDAAHDVTSSDWGDFKQKVARAAFKSKVAKATGAANEVIDGAVKNVSKALGKLRHSYR